MTDVRIPVDLIDFNPYQVRVYIDQEKIESLKDSISTSGLLSRILVRPHPKIAGRYQLVNGQRRLLAVKALAWPDVPADVRLMTNAEVAQATLVENMQREDLNPIDEAQGFKHIIDEFCSTELEVANMVGKSRAYVSNRLRLLSMDPYLIICVLAKTLAPWQALMIQVAPISEKYRLADLAIDWNLTVDELRTAINTIRSGGDSIRFKRSVPVEGLIIDPRHQGSDSSLLEEYLSKGVQLFPLSVWVDGVVRLGGRMVVAARNLGVDTLDAEVVFETAWFSKEATTPAELCSIARYSDVDIFPPRSDAQKARSRRLRELLVGMEEMYPILVNDHPSSWEDLGDGEEEAPVTGKHRAILVGGSNGEGNLPLGLRYGVQESP
ncbi:MAG: ParB/RepB/Spo0J family partition protein [Candidatus Bathyarchaeota archaeon]|nr:ParB/RepB/Spo0J family partition protein [Candidatus Bathyarchaeota archaeon]